ncbi:MAG: di-trans,poly-cis-decaprenylcistransferase [Acidobacteria bacterium]|nr:di-trans,poly-cis-decaprenylcistransferase [Acidobacteriota bacterium]
MSNVRHVAIIMDGNGRWAEQRGMPRWKGHEAGAQAVRQAVEAAGRERIEVLTLFAFSSENWRRPAKEVDILFRLLLRYLQAETRVLVENGIRLSAFGRRDRFSLEMCEALRRAEEETANGGSLHLRLALDYGARDEIAEAARVLARQVAKGCLVPEQIDVDCFTQALPSGVVPDPDLIIRTSGERRLSNFLLWQAAYSELHFCPKLWPDFTESDFLEALADYHSRTRRFGALPYAAATIG